MCKVKAVAEAMEAWVPTSLKSEGDNVGLIVGGFDRDVKKVLTAFEVTNDVIDEAVAAGADMIVCHHPLIYYPPLKAVTEEDYVGRLVIRLIENGISLYCAHTNLDWGEGGVCDTLADAVGLCDVRPFNCGEGRVGRLEPIALIDFVKRVKEALSCPHLKYVGENDRIVSKIGLCSGAGGSLIAHAIDEECDVYLSADFKYHEAHMAAEKGIAIIDAGHFETENLIVRVLTDYLSANLSVPVEMSARTRSFFSYI